MYFGSVRFFKHLIVTVLLVLIILPSALAIVSGAKYAEISKKVDKLEATLSSEVNGLNRKLETTVNDKVNSLDKTTAAHFEKLEKELKESIENRTSDLQKEIKSSIFYQINQLRRELNESLSGRAVTIGQINDSNDSQKVSSQK